LAVSDSAAAPATTIAAPESLWALPLGRIDTLEGARDRQAALQKLGVAGFARVRADRSGYWYEAFAGPVTSRAAADSLAALLKAALKRSLAPAVRGRWGELVLGAVTPLPPAPVGARPVAAPPDPPATGGASSAAPQPEAQTPLPRVLELKRPVYSDAARARALSGTVKIRVLVGEDGQARDFDIIQPVNPLLDGPALEAAAASRYAPAEVNGRPVAAWIELSFTFP
jgi:TonB family protein